MTIAQLKDQAKKAWDFVRRSEARLRLEARIPEDDRKGLQVGDEVLVSWQHLQGIPRTAKMRSRMGGPYLVKREVTPGTYELSGLTKGLPTTYHRAMLQKYQRDSVEDRARLHPSAAPLEAGEGGVHREVERIKDVREKRGEVEYWVAWKGVPERNWEKARNLVGC